MNDRESIVNYLRAWRRSTHALRLQHKWVDVDSEARQVIADVVAQLADDIEVKRDETDFAVPGQLSLFEEV